MTAVISSRLPSKQILTWKKATWEEYEQIRDRYENSDTPRVKLFFHNGLLLIDDMGWEGINHSVVRELFLLMLGFWIARNPQENVNFMGGCLLEKDGEDAASPDLALYVGADRPQWTEGETRKIDLDRWRVPNLVGEISDTTLASDLDQKKNLYADLGVSEYWVIDVRGRQVFFFCLDAQGQYCEVAVSLVLPGLATALLEQALLKLGPMTNMDVALWFQQQIATVES
ncbi:MAG: Uma2 family endonuclease [Cyanobacteria bacterium J06621_3]